MRQAVGVLVNVNYTYSLGEEGVSSIDEVFYDGRPYVKVSFEDDTEVEFCRDKILGVLYIRQKLLPNVEDVE